jgi:ABC-type uncharacterized transport system substrate-binding protein
MGLHPTLAAGADGSDNPVNRRRALAGLLALGSAAIPIRAPAQTKKPANLPVLGVLSPNYRPTPEEVTQSPVRARLKDRGWIDGQTLLFELAYGEGSEERLPDLASDLVRKRVDVIWTPGPEATVAAAKATRIIPIVFWGVAWPIELGLIDSLTRPGRNVTGVAFITASEVYGKPVEFLRQVATSAKRLAMITVPGALRAVSGQEISGIRAPVDAAARQFGFEIRHYPVQRRDDFDAAFSAIIDAHTEALFIPGTTLTWRERRRITAFANQHRLLTVCTDHELVRAGALLSYGARTGETILRSFDYVDRILRGAKAGDLPVELPSQVELAINLKTAKALGVTIPRALLLRADAVIE